MKPYLNNVFIEPDKVDSILKTSQNRITQKGTVISVGDEVTRIKAGDKVLFESFISKIELDGVPVYITEDHPSIIRGIESV